MTGGPGTEDSGGQADDVVSLEPEPTEEEPEEPAEPEVPEGPEEPAEPEEPEEPAPAVEPEIRPSLW